MTISIYHIKTDVKKNLTIDNVQYTKYPIESSIEGTEMKDLEAYIDDAKKNHDIKSDRELCRFLKVSENSINHYRNKGTYPSDETMVRLARLGRNDPEQALIDLNIWRTPAPVQSIYKNMLHKLSMLSIIAIILTTSALPAQAFTTDIYTAQSDRYYILWNLKTLI